MSPAGDQQQELRIVDYLRPIIGRKWSVLALVFLATAGTYFYYDQQPRKYTASTKIFVDSTAGNTATGQAGLPTTDRTTLNQATLLASHEVADQVAKRLHRPPGSIAGITAKPSAGSDFVTITSVNTSPEEAALLANAYAQAFIELRLTEQRTAAQKALTAAQQELEQLPRTAANATERQDAAANIRRLQLILALPTGDAQQLDPATPPSGPSAPKPLRNAVFAFFLSLVAAVGLAFVLERFDRRLKRVEDAESAYGLPLLGIVPHSDQAAMLVDDRAALNPDFREAFRQLRANIQLEGLTRPIHRILVTSALPSEGKSTVVRNLALAFGELGQLVAVLDSDLRRPSMTKLFATPTDSGLTTVMTGEDTIESAVVQVPIHALGLDTLARIEAATAVVGDRTASSSNGSSDPTLSLLASGPTPANPQAVLSARRTAMVIEELADQHDILIIDSPPLTAVSDALSLAPHVDAVIFIVRLGLSRKEGAKRAVEMLGRVPGARPIGIVINDLSSLESGYGYGYGYGSPDEPKI